jgi:hypothetical protein
VVQPVGQTAIGADLTARYLKLQAEDPLLKGPTDAEVQIIQRELDRIARKIPCDLVDDLVDGGMGVINGARKDFPYARLHDLLSRRKKNASHYGRSRLVFLGPGKTDLSKN